MTTILIFTLPNLLLDMLFPQVLWFHSVSLPDSPSVSGVSFPASFTSACLLCSASSLVTCTDPSSPACSSRLGHILRPESSVPVPLLMGSVHAPPQTSFWLPNKIPAKHPSQHGMHGSSPSSASLISCHQLLPSEATSAPSLVWNWLPPPHPLSLCLGYFLLEASQVAQTLWSSSTSIVAGTHLSPPRDPWEQRLCVPKCLEQCVPQRGHMGIFVEWTNKPMNRNKGTAVHSKQLLAHHGHVKSWRITQQSLTWGSSASPYPPEPGGGCVLGTPAATLQMPGLPPRVLSLTSLPPSPQSSFFPPDCRFSPKASESWVRTPGPHAVWINWVTPGKINLLPAGFISSQTEGPLSLPDLQRPYKGLLVTLDPLDLRLQGKSSLQLTDRC